MRNRGRQSPAPWIAATLALSLSPGCVKPLEPVRVIGDFAAADKRVVLLQSGETEAVMATSSSLLAELTAPVAVFTLRDGISLEQAAQGVREVAPDVLVALGGRAVALALRYFPETRTVVGLVMRDENAFGAAKQVSGVTVELPTRFEFMMYRLVLPSLRRVAVFYSEKASGAFIDGVAEKLNGMGLELVPHPVTSTADVEALHREVVEQSDAIWAFADPVAFAWDSFMLLRDATLAAKKALLCSGLREAVDSGALMAVATDYGNVGSQLATMTRAALENRDTDVAERFQQAAGGQLIVNAETARLIGIEIPARAMPLIGAIVGKD